jgi:UDP-2-acetamido-2-deoxy-ribo-hexuluronate aminotransferase
MEFRDLKKQYQVLKGEIDEAVSQVLQAGHYINGKEVSELEQSLARYTGVKHCVTCANGTDALSLVLMAWGIGEGDAVFIPDFTFFATGEVVAFEGATPIFVDVEENTFNMSVSKLEEAIQHVLEEGVLTPKVVIPVDLFGLPADYPEINQVAKKYNLLVLEDGAQGFGGSIGEQRACSFGDAATTSFFPAKPLGCYGDGGAIFTDDDELAEVLKSLCVHGKGSFKYDNVRVGVNSRLDTVQAAILNVKLHAFIDSELELVNKVAEEYTKRLKCRIKVPVVPKGYRSSWAQYTLQLESRDIRSKLQDTLKASGIPSMIYYPKPMSQQTALEGYKKHSLDTTNTEKLCDTVLSLPMHPYMTVEDIQFVSEKVLECLN